MTAVGGARTRQNQARKEHTSNAKNDGSNVYSPNVEANSTDDGSLNSEEGEEGQSTDEDEGEDEEDGDGDGDGDGDDDDDDEAEDEEEEGAGDGDDDEDDSPFRFLEQLDPNWLTRKSQTSTSLSAPSTNQGTSESRSPAAGADDAEFYGAMIQMLTHVLGSSDTITWPNQHTPGSQLAPSPFGHAYSSPVQTPNHVAGSLSTSSRSAAVSAKLSSKPELSALQPMIQALIARLGKDHQLPRRPVGEQDLTALLQTLMEQQQRQQEQQIPKHGVLNQAVNVYSASNDAYTQPDPLAQMPSSRSSQQFSQAQGSYGNPTHITAFQPLNFADLDFEDEDEDDPDFNPDLNPDLPLPSAWSLAVRDVVASEESRAAAAAAAVAPSHSGTPSGAQTPADGLRHDYRSGNVRTTVRSPTHTSLRGTETRRTSLEDPPPQSHRRDSLAHIATPSHADTPANNRSAAPDILFSPSGRPIRASRKRQASPTSAQTRNARAHGPEFTSHIVEDQSARRRESMQSRPRPQLHSACTELPTLSLRETEAMSSSAPPQTQSADTESSGPRKRGRKPVLEPGEAQRRRAQRNIEYQRMRRQAKKAEESEQGETVLELKAEVKMLRAEMERLRDENAMLRAQRELDRLQRSNH